MNQHLSLKVQQPEPPILVQKNQPISSAEHEVIKIDTRKGHNSNNSISLIEISQIEVVEGPRSKPIRDCYICLSEYPECELINPLSCHKFCKSCLETYFNNKISEAEVRHIKCPVVYCREYFVDIESLLENEQLRRKYRYFKNRQELDSDPLVIFCPKYECDKYVRFDGITKNIECECGIKICTDCSLEAHPERMCLVTNLDSATIKQFKIKKCPNCSILIQQESWCNRMTCKKCKYSFCWYCTRRISYNPPNKNCNCSDENDQSCFYNYFIVPIKIFLFIAIFLISTPFFILLGALEIPWNCYRKYNKKWYKIIITSILSIILLPITIPLTIIIVPYEVYKLLTPRPRLRIQPQQKTQMISQEITNERDIQE